MATTRIESAVKEAYATGAAERLDELCCPVDYDPGYLEAIPEEVVERDYGCGDPSRYLAEGETVLDLGSGTGKICFIASQVVGPQGRVIGVDMTPEMLDVARRSAPVVADRIGYANVEFRRGRIQDLALDLDLLEAELAADPVRDVDGLFAAQRLADDLRRTRPMVETDSVDVVVSNCVINLSADKPKVLREAFRVLRPGGRFAVSDVVVRGPVPAAVRESVESWIGCVAGALEEETYRRLLAEAGFEDVEVEPTRVYRAEDARSFLEEAGLDPGEAADAMDGRFMAAFVRARKPDTSAGA